MLYLYQNRQLEKLPLQVKLCDTFFKRLLGALPSGGVAPGRALLFPGCGWVHTFFMRRPIDVAYLDENGRILAYYSAVKPYRFLPPAKSAAGALELPPGRLQLSPRQEPAYFRFPKNIARRTDLPSLSDEELECPA